MRAGVPCPPRVVSKRRYITYRRGLKHNTTLPIPGAPGYKVGLRDCAGGLYKAERKNNEAENRKLLDFLAERMKTVDKEMKIKQKENAIIYKEAMLATLNEYLVLYPDTIRKAYIEKHIEEINKVIGECKKYLAGEIS
jgi:chorismate mutase